LKIEVDCCGVKANIPFLENVIQHPNFLNGEYNKSFIKITPDLFEFPKHKERGTKLLNYIGQTIVNGHPDLPSGKKLTPSYNRSISILTGQGYIGFMKKDIIKTN
jgi:pyruvate carboxylase